METVRFNPHLFGAGTGVLSPQVNPDTMETAPKKIKYINLKDDFKIDLSVEYGDLSYTISINGIGAFPKGDIQVVKAKAKQGKTHAVLCLIAGLLNGEFMAIKSLIENPKICFFGTEEHRRSTQNLGKKVHKLCNWDSKENSDRFFVYSLRAMEAKERVEFIREAIIEEKPDIVFIDGVRDLLVDFNNITDSINLVSLLLKLAEENDCAIVNVIHTNKSFSDSNMRGHLGTELLNKCSDVLEVEKSGSIINVEETDCRNIPTGKWAFSFDKEGLLVKAEIKSKEEKVSIKKEDRIEKIKKHFTKIFENGKSLNYSELRDVYMEVANVKVDASNKHIKEMVTLNIIEKNEDQKYILR